MTLYNKFLQLIIVSLHKKVHREIFLLGFTRDICYFIKVEKDIIIMRTQYNRSSLVSGVSPQTYNPSY